MVLPSATMTDWKLVQESTKASFSRLSRRYWSIRIGRPHNNKVLKQVPKLLEGIDIEERYGIFRSFEWDAITWAQEAGVVEADFNRVGQWSRVELAQDGQVAALLGGSMQEHYSELVQMLDAKLRISRAL
jgi:hypothetical protein